MQLTRTNHNSFFAKRASFSQPSQIEWVNSHVHATQFSCCHSKQTFRLEHKKFIQYFLPFGKNSQQSKTLLRKTVLQKFALTVSYQLRYSLSVKGRVREYAWLYFHIFTKINTWQKALFNFLKNGSGGRRSELSVRTLGVRITLLAGQFSKKRAFRRRFNDSNWCVSTSCSSAGSACYVAAGTATVNDCSFAGISLSHGSHKWLQVCRERTAPDGKRCLSRTRPACGLSAHSTHHRRRRRRHRRSSCSSWGGCLCSPSIRTAPDGRLSSVMSWVGKHKQREIPPCLHCAEEPIRRLGGSTSFVATGDDSVVNVLQRQVHKSCRQT